MFCTPNSDIQLSVVQRVGQYIFSMSIISRWNWLFLKKEIDFVKWLCSMKTFFSGFLLLCWRRTPLIIILCLICIILKRKKKIHGSWTTNSILYLYEKKLALGFFNVQFYFFVVTRNCICSSLSQRPPSQHLWKWKGTVRFFLQKFQILNGQNWGLIKHVQSSNQFRDHFEAVVK